MNLLEFVLNGKRPVIERSCKVSAAQFFDKRANYMYACVELNNNDVDKLCSLVPRQESTVLDLLTPLDKVSTVIIGEDLDKQSLKLYVQLVGERETLRAAEFFDNTVVPRLYTFYPKVGAALNLVDLPAATKRILAQHLRFISCSAYLKYKNGSESAFAIDFDVCNNLPLHKIEEKLLTLIRELISPAAEVMSKVTAWIALNRDCVVRWISVGLTEINVYVR